MSPPSALGPVGLQTRPSNMAVQGTQVEEPDKVEWTWTEKALGSNAVVVEHENDYFEVPAKQRPGQLDFRAKFLYKLAYSGVLLPPERRAARHQSVTIFDWDDTLLCTTYLARYQHRTVPAPLKEQVGVIEALAKGLLEAAISLGPTFIVTNAVTGWVEQCAKKWVPALLPVLEKVQIISARDRFEPLYPEDPDQWKAQAFLEVARQLDPAAVTNLIVVGDSEFEMDAAEVMRREFDEVFVKTIKMKQRPTAVEHLKQLELIARKFKRIAEIVRSMRILLEEK